MKRTISFSLKQGLIFFICILMGILVIVMLIIPTLFYNKVYEKKVEEQCNDMAMQCSYGLSEALEVFDKIVDEMVNDEQLRQIVFGGAAATTEQYAQFIKTYFNIKTFDIQYLRSVDLYIKDPDKCFLSDSTCPRLEDIFQSAIYKTALIYPNSLNWIRYDNDINYLYVARVIYDRETYMAEGLLVFRVSPKYLLDQMTLQHNEEIKHVYISDEYDQILASDDQSLIGKALEDLSVVIPSSSLYGTIYNGNSTLVYCKLGRASYTYPFMRWSIGLVLDKAELLNEFNRIRNLFLCIAIVLILLCSILIMRFAENISKPITKLARAMSEVRHENLSYMVDEASPIKEIETVNRGFNKMTKQLNQLIVEEYKNKLAQKEAELSRLQSQINPHFLFNTLQLISWKAHEYEADSVCEMIYSLSYMLEMDIYSNEKMFFQLDEELNYIRHYSNIVKYKYNGKITIDVDAPEDLRECIVPKILLQPLVENSVVHGLSAKTTPGCVKIRIYAENDDLVAVIKDDGIGMTQETISEIMVEKESAPQEGDSHHIAVRNIQSRIHLLYGEGYGLMIKSEVFEGTEITLRIPLVKGETNE